MERTLKNKRSLFEDTYITVAEVSPWRDSVRYRRGCKGILGWRHGRGVLMAIRPAPLEITFILYEINGPLVDSQTCNKPPVGLNPPRRIAGRSYHCIIAGSIKPCKGGVEKNRGVSVPRSCLLSYTRTDKRPPVCASPTTAGVGAQGD